MWSKYQNTLDFVHLDGKMDEDMESGQTAMTWESVVGLLSHHDVRMDKDGPAFMPVTLKPKEDWVKGKKILLDSTVKESLRVNQNVEAISIAVFDLDEPTSLDEAKVAFKDFEYVLYSTHSYNSDAPYKCRIALKLDASIPSENWSDFFFNIAKSVTIDESCKNLARLFYLPSIAPNAGIKPMFEHHEGNAISLEDANAIGSQNLRGLDDEGIENLKKSFGLIEKSGERRHFSGENIPLYKRRSGAADYSYEGISERHKDYLDAFKGNKLRHDFVMQVLSREVTLQGDRVDVDKIIAFLYRASKEHHPKPMNEGNTPKEIPGLFVGAYKFVKSVGEENPEFMRALPQKIQNAITKASASFVTGNWDFSSPSKAEKASVSLASIEKFDDNSFTYSSLRNRNKNLINRFMRDDDFAGFVLDVFESEIFKSKDKTNVNAVGQFVFYCLSGLTKHREMNLDNYKTEIQSLIDNDLEISLNSLVSNKEQERFPRFIKTAIKMGNHALMERSRWKFPKEQTVEQEMAR